MIGSIYSSSKNLVVNSGSPTSLNIITHPNPYNVAYPGQVRVNGSTLETFNGSWWVPISQQVTSIGLSTEGEDLLAWARKKRDEEYALERLAETNVTIAGLIREKKDLEDKIKMVHILTK